MISGESSDAGHLENNAASNISTGSGKTVDGLRDNNGSLDNGSLRNAEESDNEMTRNSLYLGHMGSYEKGDLSFSTFGGSNSNLEGFDAGTGSVNETNQHPIFVESCDYNQNRNIETVYCYESSELEFSKNSRVARSYLSHSASGEDNRELRSDYSNKNQMGGWENNMVPDFVLGNDISVLTKYMYNIKEEIFEVDGQKFSKLRFRKATPEDLLAPDSLYFNKPLSIGGAYDSIYENLEQGFDG
ncbi:hypothetical protein AYI69_g10131 [Smittium culicis]|uniref:Uncharacterized protein n=1 Tax=Smittium culicis TaxID=133412 RepID=A0A1R1X7X3_9FUNG|nr:hypothetical protein AYI69_g10131 [Smittium culicis]